MVKPIRWLFLRFSLLKRYVDGERASSGIEGAGLAIVLAAQEATEPGNRPPPY
jgi:hypothetical protein